jgi:hypothetical protein
MKNYLSKVFAALLIAGLTISAFAQQAQTATPKVTDQSIKDTQASTVSTMVNTVDGLVKLTDDQKTKLTTALQNVIAKSEAARKAMKNDDSKLQAWREQKVADIKAQLKLILTPQQYDIVIKNGGN